MKRNYLHKYNITDVQSDCCNQIVGNDSLSFKHLRKNPITLKSDRDFAFKDSYTASNEFWYKSQKAGMFNLMFYFTRLKFRDNYQKPDKTEGNPFNDTKLNKEYFAKLKTENKLKNNHCDLTYGFIRRADLKKIAKRIRVPYNTLRTIIPKLESSGFIIRTHTGWRMISMNKAAALIGINLKRLRIKANTKQELKSILAYNIIKKTIHKKNKVLHQTNNNMSITLSCKKLSEKLGYKSATTGSYREKTLEKDKRLIVFRQQPFYDYIWKRPCNTLILLKKTA